MASVLSRLVEGSEIQRRINELDKMLSNVVRHPECCADPTYVEFCIEGEIMQLEAAQLAQIEDDRFAERSVKKKENVIYPIISSWGIREQVE